GHIAPRSVVCSSVVCHLLRSRVPSVFPFFWIAPHRDLHSFPTRRSSDLGPAPRRGAVRAARRRGAGRGLRRLLRREAARRRVEQDRKSTRLNSSHRTISYAVFCLKKKKIRCSFVFDACLVTSALSSLCGR